MKYDAQTPKNFKPSPLTLREESSVIRQDIYIVNRWNTKHT